MHLNTRMPPRFGAAECVLMELGPTRINQSPRRKCLCKEQSGIRWSHTSDLVVANCIGCKPRELESGFANQCAFTGIGAITATLRRIGTNLHHMGFESDLKR